MKEPVSHINAVEATNPNWEYRSYLIRLWRPDAGTAWRFMVQRVGSNTSRTFTDARELVAFLQNDDQDNFFTF